MALIIGSYPDGGRRRRAGGHRDLITLDADPWLILGLRSVGANPDAVLKKLGGGQPNGSKAESFDHNIFMHGVGMSMYLQTGAIIYAGPPLICIYTQIYVYIHCIHTDIYMYIYIYIRLYIYT